MKRGRHAADDGSFARSAGVNAGRGAILIVVALVVGFLLLNDLDNGSDFGGGSVSAGRSQEETTTTRAPVVTVPATTTAPPKAPKDVKVLVINGTTTAGAAARVATVLKDKGGYNVLRAVDASAQVKATTKASAVYYVTRDFEREAKAIQLALELPPSPVTAVPTPPPATEVNTANVVVVVGPDLAKSGGTAATTTTRGSSTATTARTTTTR